MICFTGCSETQTCADAKPWENTSLPLEARASALLDQLSLEEKLGLLDADKPPTGAIPRLDIPAFEGWNGAPWHALASEGPGFACMQKILPII